MIIPVAAATYVATNLDNLVLLASLLSHYRNNTAAVVAGYLTCMLILGVVSFWIGTFADYISVESLGLLGLVPIYIGVISLVRLRYGQPKLVLMESAVGGLHTVFVATLITQLSNGVDTIVTFGALFADSKAAADLLIAITLAVMAVIFALVGLYAVQLPAMSDWIKRYAHRVTPFIFIFVGFYVLINTNTDILAN